MITSTKTITFFADTTGIRKLESSFGGRLSGLSKAELYQLAAIVSSFLSVVCEGGGEIDDFSLVSFAHESVFDTENVVVAALFILREEEPETLACLLPAITQYARDSE
jgi:hypothetical protein